MLATYLSAYLEIHHVLAALAHMLFVYAMLRKTIQARPELSHAMCKLRQRKTEVSDGERPLPDVSNTNKT